MAHDDKMVESIRFLLGSVKKLSDSFLALDGKVRDSFKLAANDVSELCRRVDYLELQLADVSDEDLARSRLTNEALLPAKSGTPEQIVSILNLPLDQILNVYANTPILLEPFSRPCSLSARTLSGEIEAVELEVFAQGSSWALETRDGDWLLLPRPGSLERKMQLQTLERLYVVDGVQHLPAMLHVISPAQLMSVVYGRRWQLKEKGALHVNPDPLRAGITARLADVEKRVLELESRGDS